MTRQARMDGLAEFDHGWLEALDRTPLVRLIYGLAGLTRLGERPAALDRLARIVNQPLQETAELVGENTTARIEDGLVHWDDPFPGEHTRRLLYLGDREIEMRSGCAPDLPLYAGVLDVPFRVEDTCAATGTPIRIEFIPDGYRQADPPATVTVLLPVDHIGRVVGASLEQIDSDVCAYQPFFASPAAAEGWLAAHPGGRVFTLAEMFERPWYQYFRDELRR